jgi:hypothetical protein
MLSIVHLMVAVFVLLEMRYGELAPESWSESREQYTTVRRDRFKTLKK